MGQISERDYWMGRDQRFPDEVTPEKVANAKDLLARVNPVLLKAAAGGVTFEINPKTGSIVSSGFRPASINAGTAGAAPRSKHMECNAVDVYDPDGDLDDWCMDNLEALAQAGLYLEHPSATKGWCHMQRIAPRSGKRVFYP